MTTPAEPGPAAAGDPRVRAATPGDVAAIVALVHELAAYERAAQECLLTVEQAERALFGPQPAVFCHVAASDTASSLSDPGSSLSDPDTVGGAAPAVVGIAIWFRSFSTWEGEHGIYLEDLYVSPAERGRGLGRALLAALAAECARRGYRRLEWQVLDWNAPAIAFYRGLGAAPHEGWTVFRLSGSALRALAP